MFTIAASGQTLKQWVDEGDFAFSKEDYDRAYQCYKIALEIDSSRLELWYQFAESARLFHIYPQAEKGYERVYSIDESNTYPKIALWLGMTKQTLEKYEEAIYYFEEFLNNGPTNDKRLIEIAEKGIENSRWALEQFKLNERLIVAHMGPAINSEYSEFGVATKGDTMYFSSYRFINKKDTVSPPRPYIKIVRSIGGQEIEILPNRINIPGKHVGHTAFNHDYSTVYYTICDFTGETNIRCDLYRSEVFFDGKWGDPEYLPINIDGFTSTEPAVGTEIGIESSDEYLYFASDRPGGAGGMDLWKVKILENGDLEVPENLSLINSPSNEMTPFFHSPSQVLYFSSDGFQSYGGFDVFRSIYMPTGYYTGPSNLGRINSSYNDLYYTLSEDSKTAYFSSNRPDDRAIFWDEEKETCCNDLYNLYPPDLLELNLSTYDLAENTDLTGVTLQLIQITQEGERVVQSIINPTGNNFSFVVSKNGEYRIEALKPGFTSVPLYLDLKLPEFKGIQEILKKLYLEPGLELEVYTYNQLDSLELLGTTINLKLIDEFGQEILIKTKENLNFNDFHFTLVKNKTYIIEAIKPGYFTRLDTIDLSLPSFSAKQKIRRELYLGQLLEILTFDAVDQTPLDSVNIELYEFDGVNIKKLVYAGINPFGNDHLIPIDLTKKYYIKASRVAFFPVEEMISFQLDDMIKSKGKFTIELYLQRESFSDFLPLALYFDNDQPDPRSYGTTTDKTYIETNEVYYGRKDEFIEEFTIKLEGEEKFLTKRRFEDFFDREVRGGNEDLVDFSNKLLRFIRGGGSITIVLRGYASPRAGSKYNQILTQRRIDSVVNHFESFENGALKDYIQAGKIKFVKEPLGESKAPEGISDELNDPRNSIFGLKVSVERRVEIEQVELDRTTSIDRKEPKR